MNAASRSTWSDPSLSDQAESGFRSIFDRAPIPAAICDQNGRIVERNAAFEQAIGPEIVSSPALRLADLASAEERSEVESQFRPLLEGTLDSARIKARDFNRGPAIANWVAWRQPGGAGAAPQLLVVGETGTAAGMPGESALQAQRWEAVGRLAGGVVHDFNNLLTGVMLYCDLLLSSFDPRDRRRRYADEIRAAIIQASGLVKQLLVFARPDPPQVRAQCFNNILVDMRDLLTRLIGSKIELEFRLDSDLGLIRIDRSQAQQIVLNLVLNARDALPEGGRIVVETSNCNFKTVAGSMQQQASDAFPCVLIVVSDNGHGMDAKTKTRLFEPFFSTKSAGKGTGLGLTTVRGIVTTNHGLIHVESEPGRGTRVLILLPRVSPPIEAEVLETTTSHADAPRSPIHEVKKGSLL